jgi:hypothetical protein
VSLAAFDVIIPCRPGPNEELRYALRSLANLPHGRVVIAGAWPDWVRNVTTVPVERRAGKYEQTTANLLAALDHVDGPFWHTYDDVFVMHPMGGIPVMHRGDLREVVAPPNHARAMRALAAHLRAEELPTLCYETHAPMLLEPQGVLDAIRFAVAPSVRHQVKRSVYGNLQRIGGELTHDFKTIHAEPWPFLSTNETVFARRPVGELIRRTFPDPSPYEVPDADRRPAPPERHAAPDDLARA